MAKKNTAPLPNPLGETTSHSTRLQTTAAKSLVIPQAGEGIKKKGEETELRVAYHAGPAEIGFAGRRWQVGVGQPVTAEEWTAMQLRADFNEHQFSEE